MVIQSLELETVCGITSRLPQNDKIEMAFWGRSNVGKSSLINGLMNRKSFRHEPSEKDVSMYRMLVSKGFNPLIIATKADKVSRNTRNKHISAIQNKLRLVEGTPVLPFSAQSREGKDEIWEYIDYFVKEMQL